MSSGPFTNDEYFIEWMESDITQNQSSLVFNFQNAFVGFNTPFSIFLVDDDENQTVDAISNEIIIDLENYRYTMPRVIAIDDNGVRLNLNVEWQ